MQCPSVVSYRVIGTLQIKDNAFVTRIMMGYNRVYMSLVTATYWHANTSSYIHRTQQQLTKSLEASYITDACKTKYLVTLYRHEENSVGADV